MSCEYDHPGGLPDSDWGKELCGKKLEIALLGNSRDVFSCEVIDETTDFENWRTLFITLKRNDDGVILNVNPLAIAHYKVVS